MLGGVALAAFAAVRMQKRRRVSDDDAAAKRDSDTLSDQPPPPPDMRRELRLSRPQIIFLPLIAAVVIAALGGAFGETTASTTATSRTLHVHLAYPARMRYRQTQTLTIDVRNSTALPLDSVRVALDTSYLASFAAVQVRPGEREGQVVPLGRLEAAESRRVLVELSGDRYWRHDARMFVSSGGDTARVAFSTFVFP